MCHHCSGLQIIVIINVKSLHLCSIGQHYMVPRRYIKFYYCKLWLHICLDVCICQDLSHVLFLTANPTQLHSAVDVWQHLCNTCSKDRAATWDTSCKQVRLHPHYYVFVLKCTNFTTFPPGVPLPTNPTRRFNLCLVYPTLDCQGGVKSQWALYLMLLLLLFYQKKIHSEVKVNNWPTTDLQFSIILWLTGSESGRYEPLTAAVWIPQQG